MKMHRILFDQETEDKIIGGKYTMRQGLYLMIMIMIPAWLFLANSNFQPSAIIIKIVVSIIVTVICLRAAFKKVSVYYWDYYLIKKFKFNRRKKATVYRKY